MYSLAFKILHNLATSVISVFYCVPNPSQVNWLLPLLSGPYSPLLVHFHTFGYVFSFCLEMLFCMLSQCHSLPYLLGTAWSSFPLLDYSWLSIYTSLMALSVFYFESHIFIVSVRWYITRHLLISWLASPSSVILEPKKICYGFHCFPIYLPCSVGTGCHDLSLFNVEF